MRQTHEHGKITATLKKKTYWQIYDNLSWMW